MQGLEQASQVDGPYDLQHSPGLEVRTLQRGLCRRVASPHS